MRLLVALLLVAGAARAEEVVMPDIGFRIVPPESWKPRPSAVEPLTQALRDDQHLTGGLAWEGKGGALFVLWRVSRDPIAGDRVAAARQALDAFSDRRGTVLRASRSIGEWDATAFVDVEPERGTLILARVTLFVDKTRRLREIRAECTLRKEHLDAEKPLCEAALASFALAVADEDLLALRAAPDAGAPAATPPPPPAPPPAKDAAAQAARPWWAGPGLFAVVLLLPILAILGWRLWKDLRK